MLFNCTREGGFCCKKPKIMNLGYGMNPESLARQPPSPAYMERKRDIRA